MPPAGRWRRTSLRDVSERGERQCVRDAVWHTIVRRRSADPSACSRASAARCPAPRHSRALLGAVVMPHVHTARGTCPASPPPPGPMRLQHRRGVVMWCARRSEVPLQAMVGRLTSDSVERTRLPPWLPPSPSDIVAAAPAAVCCHAGEGGHGCTCRLSAPLHTAGQGARQAASSLSRRRVIGGSPHRVEPPAPRAATASPAASSLDPPPLTSSHRLTVARPAL